MIQSSGVEESPVVTGTAGTKGSLGLRRSARETPEKKSVSPVNRSRKSESLKKNSPEASPSKRKTESQGSPTPLRRSERGKSQSPLTSNGKSSTMADARVRPQGINAGNSEGVGAKRRKMDARRFMSLFGQNNNNHVSTEPIEEPKLLGADEHHSVSNQSANKLRKKSVNSSKDPDLMLAREVCNVVKVKPSEHNVDHEFPASRSKVSPVEHDPSTRIESKIQAAGVLTVSDQDALMERETDTHDSVQKDRGLTLHVEGDKVEVTNESRVTSMNEAATSKESSLCVNVAVEAEATIHSRERDADDIKPIAPVVDQAQGICSDSANVSPSRSETNANKRKRKIVNSNETEDVQRLRKVVLDSIDVTYVVENQDVITSDKGSECARDLSQVIAADVCIPSELHVSALESGTMSEESNKSHDTEMSLHLLLKPKLRKLCELLKFSEDVKKLSERFLDYVVGNHHVTRESVTLSQAFLMSVCWIAASLQKQKINCQESLVLARKHLNFRCGAEETDYMYLRMLLFKELFTQSTVDDKTNGHAWSVFPVRETSEDFVVGLNPVTSESKSPSLFDAEKLMVKIIRDMNKKCRERMKNLVKNQGREFEELQKSNAEEKAQLERGFKVEVAVVRTIHGHNLSVVTEKLKALEDQHSKRLEEHINNLSNRSKSLEDKHSSEKEKENELTSSWKEDIIKELLGKLTCYNSEDGKRKFDGNEQLGVLDSQKESRASLDYQEILKSRPDALSDIVEGCKLATPDKSLASPSASSEAGNIIFVVDSGVSASAKVLPENAASFISDNGQVTCGQAAKFVDLTSAEAQESSSVDVLPLKLSTSALPDGPSPDKTLDCLTTSRQMSPSAVLIPGSGLLNTVTIDLPLAISSDKAISVRNESEAPAVGHSVPLPPSAALLDNEVDNSSLVSPLKADNGLPPSQLNGEAPGPKVQPEIPYSTITSGFEQSDFQYQLGQLVVHITTDNSNDNLTAKELHKLPATEKQPGLPPTSTAGSKQSQSDVSLLHTATGPSNVNASPAEAVVQLSATEKQPELPSSTIITGDKQSHLDNQLLRTASGPSSMSPSASEVVVQSPATEKQLKLLSSTITTGYKQSYSDIQQLHTASGLSIANPSAAEAVAQPQATEIQQQFPCSSGTTWSDKSDSGIQLEALRPTATDHNNAEPSTAEAVHQLPATPWQPELPCSIITPGNEQGLSDIQLDESLIHTANHSNVDSSAPGALHPLRATEGRDRVPSSTVFPGSEQSHTDIDRSLLHTTTGHFDPSAAEAMQLAELPFSVITPGFEQSDSDNQPAQSLLQIAADRSNIDHLAAEAGHQLSATEEQLELPSSTTAPRSGQFDSDNEPDNVEPSAGEAVRQLSHSPLVDSSSSQHHSSLPVLEELPSGGLGATLNADAPTSSSPSAVSVSCISPTGIAISQPQSISGPRATIAISDFPSSWRPGATVCSTVSARMQMFPFLDPLQGELERIQKEADHSVKQYEEMKQLLNSECEKAIEEMVARIRKKYEMKNVELDTEMEYKKNELGVYRSKVYMNRMLAEIFRNKCIEPKVFVPPGIPQDIVQHQVHRHQAESAPRPPIIGNTSSSVPTLGNMQGTHSSTPLRHSDVGSVSSAAPTIRMQGAHNPVRPGSPAAAPSQNATYPGGPSAASCQNSIRPSASTASAPQNYLDPGVPAAPFSVLAGRMSGSLQAPHNRMRPGPGPGPGKTNGIYPATPLPRSTTPCSSGLPSSSPHVTPAPRSVGTCPPDQQTMTRPVQVVNRSALFSGNSVRPVSTTCATPPTVNLHSVSGMRAPAPHLRSRVSQPAAPNTTISTCIPSWASHPQYANVSLLAPSGANQHSASYPRAPASHSASAAISVQQVDTVSSLRMTSYTENNRLRNRIAVGVSHSLTAQLPTPLNDGGICNLPPASTSTTGQVVCLSDDE